MKSTIAVLLGLLVISFAQETADEDSGEQFSWDSVDGSNEDGSATESYHGLIIQVYQPDGEALVITLSSRKDSDRVYCLNFARVFEATGFAVDCNTDCTYSIVAGTEVDLADANCVISQVDDQNFDAVCDNVNGGTLTLNFKFKQLINGDYGIEYTINLEGYIMQAESASFVMEQGITECSDDYSNSGDSGSVSGEEEEDDDDTTTNPPAGRRLLGDETDSVNEADESNGDDTDSEDEESGISSDDSKEFDVDAAQFIITGTANDVCTDAVTGTTSNVVDYHMVYQRESKSIQIVFDPFTCALNVDPVFAIDTSKTSAGNTIQTVIASLFVAVGAMLVF